MLMKFSVIQPMGRRGVLADEAQPAPVAALCPRPDVQSSTMPQEQLLDRSVSILRRCGLNAGWQDTGGGTLCVIVADADGHLDEPRFSFGNAGMHWAAEVDGDPAGLWTDVAADEDNPTQIARGILAALTRFSQNQP